MGHLGVPAAVTRPYGHAARVPVIRTGGGLAKRLGRMLLWLLVLVLLLRGLASVLSAREPAPVTRVVAAPTASWPDDAARAFASDFARAYLYYSPDDPDGSARAVQAFVGPDLASSIAPQHGEHAERESVGAVSVASSATVDARHALVSVAAATSSGTRDLTGPVATDGRGGLLVSGLPSFTAGPARAVLEPPSTEPIPASERSGIEDVTTRFLRAYLGG